MLSIVKLRLLSLRDNYMVFLVMTAMALGFTAVFGISFNTYRPSVIIVDEDNTPYSAEFIEELKQNQIFKFVDSDKENAIAGVEEGKILAALIIDEGFHDDIEQGNEIKIGQIKIKDDKYLLTLQETVRGITSTGKKDPPTNAITCIITFSNALANL
jgi:ABC-2 type transport system permease protein